MGFDGIPIDTYEKTPGELDVTTMLTEYSSAVQQVRSTATNLEHPGAVTEISVASENLVALLRLLTPDLFLAVVLRPDGLSGKARYLMRVAGPAIADELL
jgi:predicted regulator of Ras-like GTPase activity (Roadblock/LC7/MglB family)